MTKPQVKIVNAETGEEIIRDMSPDEIAQMQNDKATAKIEIDEIAAKATAKQAVLDKLGLTKNEVAALLG